MNYIIDTQKAVPKTEIDEQTIITENDTFIYATYSARYESTGIECSIIVKYPKPRFKIEGGENNE